jgi:uncharacterized protein YndB with AHSA1/START domain
MASPRLYRVAASVEIRATPEAAFDAWLDPRRAARFLAANNTNVAVFENDPREGGGFRLVMGDEGRLIEHEGRYVVIDRPKRLIFTWVSAGTDHHLSLVTLTFTATASGVRIDLEHDGLPDAERAGRHEGGWSSILRKFASLDL